MAFGKKGVRIYMRQKIVMVLEKDLIYPVLDRRVFKEAMTLQENGYHITIITWSMRMDKNKYPDSYEMKGIKIIRIFQSVVSPDKSNIYKIIPFLNLFYKTLKILLKIKPDYIHCHDAFPLLVSYLGAKFTKSKLIYDSHELNPFREEPKVFLRFFDISEKIALRQISYIITANEVRREFMQKRLNKKFIFLDNYPDFSLEKIKISKTNDIVKFLYQGGVSTHRGIDNILKAMSELQDFSFLFEIYGMYQPNKKKYIDLVKKYDLEDKVFLNDAIPIEILEEKMKKMDIGVVSILNTSLNNYYCAPNKLYDYMKAGLVILGPSFPHIKEEINENNIGFTCNYEDISSIKNTFLKILNSKKNLLEMKKRAFVLYQTKCNWKAQENKLLELYEELKNE
jgi:glycosyltransferase involved in cell wall biosynthesis